MNLSNSIVYLLTNLGIFGIISFLLKGLIQKSFDKDIERFKSNLQKSATEHQIRFARLHDDRAEVTRNIFTKLAKMQRSLKSYMNIVQMASDEKELLKKHDEQGKTAEKETNNFIRYYSENEVLLPDDICGKINALIGRIQDAWNIYDIWVENAGQSSVNGRPNTKKWLEALTIIEEEVPKIKKQLKEKMGKILGVVTNGEIS